jgi:hypothetical protein
MLEASLFTTYKVDDAWAGAARRFGPLAIIQ